MTPVRTSKESAIRVTVETLQEWSLRTGIEIEIWAFPPEPLPAFIEELVHGTIQDVQLEVERQGCVRTISIALTVAPNGRRVSFVSLGGSLSVNAVPGEAPRWAPPYPHVFLPAE